MELLRGARDNDEILPWMANIYKFGHQYMSPKIMLRLSQTQPSFFASLCVRVGDIPERQTLSLGNDRHVIRIFLQKLTQADDVGLLIHDLGQAWIIEDPEKTFRQVG